MSSHNQDNVNELTLTKWLDSVKQNNASVEQEEIAQLRLMLAIEQFEVNEAKDENHAVRLFAWLKNISRGGQVSMAFSVAMAAVLTIGFSLSSSVISPAFAQIQQTLKQASSMQYSGVMLSNGEPTMEMKVYYQQPNKVRIETSPLLSGKAQGTVTTILDTQAGKGLTLISQAKMAMPFEFATSEEGGLPEEEFLSWMDTILEYDGEVILLASKNINDVFATGYEIYESGMTITLWVESASQLPISLRVQSDVVNGQTAFEFNADLRFNGILDETLFDINAQEGYQLVSGEQQDAR
jgi:outer membrane lipoprotein-sorting protein